MAEKLTINQWAEEDRPREKLLLMVRDLGQERTFAYIRFLLGCEDND